MSVLELIKQTDVGFEGRSNTVFGKLQLHLVRVSKRTGNSISIPGVQGHSSKPKDADGNMLFNGLVKNGSGDRLLMAQVLTKTNADGESYQVVKQYRTKEFSTDKVQQWEKYGFPPVKSFFGERIDEYMGQTTDNIIYSGKSAWVQAEEIETGEEYDGKPITYWEFETLYSQEDDMRLAEKTFWLKVRGNSGDSENVQSDVPVELATPPTSNWTSEAWQSIGVTAVLKAKKEGKENAAIASDLGVDMPFVLEVLEKVPF